MPEISPSQGVELHRASQGSLKKNHSITPGKGTMEQLFNLKCLKAYSKEPLRSYRLRQVTPGGL